MNKKLRLILLPDCNRSCEGCCNNNYDLNSLPVLDGYSWYEEIIITGGEPMLRTDLITEVVMDARDQSDAKIYMYTAKSKRTIDLLLMLVILDGITLTLHEIYDIEPFIRLTEQLVIQGLSHKSLRLNVFKHVSDSEEYLNVNSGILSVWSIKDDIEWIDDCPMPIGEDFKRLWK